MRRGSPRRVQEQVPHRQAWPQAPRVMAQLYRVLRAWAQGPAEPRAEPPHALPLDAAWPQGAPCVFGRAGRGSSRAAPVSILYPTALAHERWHAPSPRPAQHARLARGVRAAAFLAALPACPETDAPSSVHDRAARGRWHGMPRPVAHPAAPAPTPPPYLGRPDTLQPSTRAGCVPIRPRRQRPDQRRNRMARRGETRHGSAAPASPVASRA